CKTILCSQSNSRTDCIRSNYTDDFSRRKRMTTTTRRAVGSAPLATSQRNWLAEIRTDVKARPVAAVFYGVPGIGKTTVAANIPNVVFLTDATEDGITTLKV